MQSKQAPLARQAAPFETGHGGIARCSPRAIAAPACSLSCPPSDSHRSRWRALENRTHQLPRSSASDAKVRPAASF